MTYNHLQKPTCLQCYKPHWDHEPCSAMPAQPKARSDAGAPSASPLKPSEGKDTDQEEETPEGWKARAIAAEAKLKYARAKRTQRMQRYRAKAPF